MTTAVFALLAYLIGSIPFAVIISRLFGLADPRSYGSKNPGATNVLRSGNRLAALLTLLGDAAKGWFAVWLIQRLGLAYGAGILDVAVVAFAVFIGHVLPIFLGFKGGKGVSTAAGVLLGLDLWIGLAVGAAWIFVAIVWRYSSLASIIAAISAPLFTFYFLGADARLAAVTLVALVLVLRHRENIGRLVAGAESRIGQSKTGSGKV